MSERRYNKCNTATTNQIEVVQAPLLQEEISDVHVRNPNYKGKNYDPNFQAKCAETNHVAPYHSKQQIQPAATGNQYKQAYSKPATSSHGNPPIASSSDIVEVIVKSP